MSAIMIGDKRFDVKLDIIDVAAIQSKTPKVTGRLSAGFHVNTNGDIVNDVEYVDKIEFGTSTMPGRFMIAQSIPEIQERHAQQITREIDVTKVLNDFTVEVKI